MAKTTVPLSDGAHSVKTTVRIRRGGPSEDDRVDDEQGWRGVWWRRRCQGDESVGHDTTRVVTAIK